MDRLDIYFASLVGMTLHPGYLKPGAQTPSLEECLELAEKMVDLRSTSWPSPPPQ